MKKRGTAFSISGKTMLPIIALLTSANCFAEDNDSLMPSYAGEVHENRIPPPANPKDRLSYELRLNPGSVLALDEYVKKWLKDDKTYSAALELHYLPLNYGEEAETECQKYAVDYNYPTFSFGLRYNFNRGTEMHKDEDPSWGEAIPVGYTSRLGDVVTLYSRFSRPLWHIPIGKTELTVSYYLGGGAGYSITTYNKENSIDNEFIGSHLNIYFTAGAEALWRFARNWGISAGVDFSHHSNGALYRPNKGSNYIGPFIGLAYYPGMEEKGEHTHLKKDECNGQTSIHSDVFPKTLYLELSLGIGAKTLLEDWQKTQYHTSPEAPEYRKEDFSVYAAFSFQADVMYRYARRWASGIGADVFYGSYSKHIKALDHEDGFTDRHSPWSLGIAAKHEVFYNNLSMRMGLGYYLFRRMGHSAKEIEKPYYERVGLHYSFPALNGLSIGFNVNAHLTKADFTEIQLSYPVRL